MSGLNAVFNSANLSWHFSASCVSSSGVTAADVSPLKNLQIKSPVSYCDRVQMASVMAE